MFDKTILITGATGLLGKMFVKQFLQINYQVVIISSSQKKINDFLSKYPEQKRTKQLQACLVDLLSNGMEETIKKYLQENACLPHYLINNARSLEYVSVNDYRNISEEKWLGEYRLDVVIPYKLMILLSEMDGCKLESIVNISSMYGMLSYNSFLCKESKAISVNYGAAKAALIQLTKEMAVRLVGKSIRVNAVSYGGVEGRANNEFKERYAKICPSKKMLSQEDVIGHVEYLCSDLSKGMTGHNLVIDGGFSLW